MAGGLVGWVRRSVRRAGADSYMRLMLVSFAVVLLGTRVYLALAGYPQVGGEVLHIAHALWGGLLLFAASLLPLLVASRWAFPTAALLSGVGAGLFVDEVGKFITVDNDYFFPAAAPIVYAVFLLSVLVYLQVRGPTARDPRTELYAALEEFKEVLDHDLEPAERARLEARLARAGEHARHSDQPELGRLADVLLGFVRSDTLSPTLSQPGTLQRWRRRLEQRGARWVTEPRLRLGLVAGLACLGALAAGDLVVVVAVALDSADGSRGVAAELANRLARIEVDSGRGLLLLAARIALDVITGLLLLVAAVLLLGQRKRTALRMASYSLLLSLTVVNLLVFYFVQFLAAVGALAQLALLHGVSRYRRRYLDR